LENQSNNSNLQNSIRSPISSSWSGVERRLEFPADDD
jgi:hypothetical protein